MRTHCARFSSSLSTRQNATGQTRSPARSGTSLARPPGSGSTLMILAMACPRSASRLRPTVGGAPCSATTYLRPIWHRWSAVRRVTAGGRCVGVVVGRGAEALGQTQLGFADASLAEVPEELAPDGGIAAVQRADARIHGLVEGEAAVVGIAE